MRLKKFFNYIFQKEYLRHYIIAAGALVILTTIVFLILRFSTNHGQNLSVPNLTGYSVSKATEILDDKNLRLELIDSVYTGPGKPGTIIDQNPPPDFKVKSNRKIFVTIKAFTRKMIKMPDFVHTTLVQAKADLETYGLGIGKITYEPSIYDNIVLEQKYEHKKIKPGTLIPLGADVDLILGKSQNMGNTVAPDLFGLSESDAEMEAVEFMLNIGTVIYDNTVRTYADTLNAKVIKQNPRPGIAFNPGDEVDIWLSLDTDTVN
jgi:eukaryotic-like serine/threonine-protein kinase